MPWGSVVATPDEALLGRIRANLSKIKVPGHGDRVRKTECVLSFDSPESPEGIFVSMSNFQGYGADYIALDHQRNGSELYLNIKWKKIPKAVDPSKKSDEAPTKLAIGVEGGFQTEEEEFEFEKSHFLAVMPEKVLVPLPNAEVPELISMVVDGILKASDLSNDEAQVMAWEDKRLVSKHAAGLTQLPGAKKISPDPATWACEDCGVKSNLWLNLSDGYIGSGRAQVDATGQMGGGTGAALKHYQDEKAKGNNYPLAVKLGTITPHGADVYCYAADEDDMVEDPGLGAHLAHFGINMMNMEKSEKTMAELQIDLNIKFDFDKICESGKTLQTLAGPGFVGLKNLGNSCYVNSVLQVLMTLPEMKERYLARAPAIFAEAPAGGAAEDLNTQMAKLATALLSERYAPTAGPCVAEAAVSVSPQMLKFLVGKGHAEFSTGNQQDAEEYLKHLLAKLDRAQRPDKSGLPLTSKLLDITMETKLVDLQSGKSRYSTTQETMLSLLIPMDAAVNSEEVKSYEERSAKRQKGEKDEEAPVKPEVPFRACLEKFCGAERIEYKSPVTGANGEAAKTTLIKTFPKYLAVHMKRYILGDDWRAKKLEVQIAAPEELDLSFLRSPGPQPGEDLLPEDAAAPPAAGPTPDGAIVQALMGMGFAENGCKRAALATSNAGAEQAMEWVLMHMGDADFNDPIPAPGSAPGAAPAVSEESVAMLMSMGFGKPHATKALRETGGDLERAADWLFSRADQLDTMDVDEPAAGEADAASSAEADAGVPAHQPKYRLLAFISHIGSSTACGHYVCHIKKDGKWTIFNDRKVAVSEEPPIDLGYIYLYESLGPE